MREGTFWAILMKIDIIIKCTLSLIVLQFYLYLQVFSSIAISVRDMMFFLYLTDINMLAKTFCNFYMDMLCWKTSPVAFILHLGSTTMSCPIHNNATSTMGTSQKSLSD